MPDDESIVIKPREFSDDLLLPENTDQLAKFMDQPLSAIAETITGAMAAGPKSWMVIGGRIVQGILKGRLFQQVSREIKELRDKGKMPDDFADEKKYKYGFKSWVELLTVIDEEAPDADRLHAIKAMFYEVNKINATDSERMINYQMFQIAKRLTSGELLVLKATYEASKQGSFVNIRQQIFTLFTWVEIIAKQMGNPFVDMVIRDQRRLTDEGLLAAPYTQSTTPAQNTQFTGQTGRMNDFGQRFCEAIRDYELQVKEQK